MKIIVKFPDAVAVECNVDKFYNMVEQYDNMHFSDTFVNQLIEVAPAYITDVKWHALDNMPPLMPDDITLICQQEVMKQLIEKYQ